MTVYSYPDSTPAFNLDFEWAEPRSVVWQKGNIQFHNSTEMFSLENRDWPPSRIDADVGGPFFLKKVTYQISQAPWLMTTRYRGNVFLQPNFNLVPLDYKPVTELELVGLGTTLIARAAPTNPNSDLLLTLGELKKDGLPTFGKHLVQGKVFLPDTWKTRLKDITSHSGRKSQVRGTASDYLGYEFALKPLVSEIRSMAQSVITSSKTIEAHRKGSSYQIRRGRSLPSSTVSAYETSCQTRPGVAYANMNGQQVQTVSSRTWFKGAFRYYVPMGATTMDRIRRAEQEANKLLGTRLTIEVLWELAPWSWAVDWFTNTGDIMTNIANLGNDSLAMSYGYAMSQTDRVTTSSGGREANLSVGQPKISLTSVKTESTKRRIKASPYAFGDGGLNGLSTRQLAISTALGITKGLR